jgi:hypothetical protein
VCCLVHSGHVVSVVQRHACYDLSVYPMCLPRPAQSAFVDARRAGHAVTETETATGRLHNDAHRAVKGARCRFFIVVRVEVEMTRLSVLNFLNARRALGRHLERTVALCALDA